MLWLHQPLEPPCSPLPTSLQLPRTYPACPRLSINPRAFAQAISSVRNLFSFFLDWLTSASFRSCLKYHFFKKTFSHQIRAVPPVTHSQRIPCQLALIHSSVRFFFFISMSPLQDIKFKESGIMSVCVYCCIPRAYIAGQLAYSRYSAQ